MTFQGGRYWSGSAASRAANREGRRVRRLFSGISFRRRAARLMILLVRERIRARIGGCWGCWSRVAADIQHTDHREHRGERDRGWKSKVSVGRENRLK